jgi:hypothetical protein
MYNSCLARFYMWVQHVVYPAVAEEEKKDWIHDQNGGKPNRYVSSKDIRDRQNASSILSPAGEVTGSLRLRWPWALDADHGPSPAGGFTFFV